jgi:hypothetical protein
MNTEMDLQGYLKVNIFCEKMNNYDLLKENCILEVGVG